MANLPLVTVGVVSFNRLRYLKALMHSAKVCLEYPNIQWIIVDGNSREAGLREYIESLDFVQEKVFMDCTHAEAMNEIVRRTQGEFLMILPEDVQFVVQGNWLQSMVEVASKYPQIGNITFNFQRRATIEKLYGNSHLHIRIGTHRWYLKLPFKRNFNTYTTSDGTRFLGMGNMREGIVGSGIMSFMRTSYWRTLGPWRTTNSAVGNDSSLGAEDDMVNRFFQSGMNLENVLMQNCVCADLVTDMRGTKARVRGGNKRYGNYLPPQNGQVYYQIKNWEDQKVSHNDSLPIPFEGTIVPLGFQLPFDNRGNLLKASDVDLSGSYETI